MLKFSANLSFLFTEDSFLDRFGAAARAGFTGVEFLFHYDFDKSVMAEVMLTSGVEVVQFNLPAGNWAGGERGIACLPDRKAEFQEGVGQAIEYAEALGCTRLNCLAGIVPALAAVPPSATARIRSGAESVLCSTALLRRGFIRAYFARPPCCAGASSERFLLDRLVAQ